MLVSAISSSLPAPGAAAHRGHILLIPAVIITTFVRAALLTRRLESGVTDSHAAWRRGVAHESSVFAPTGTIWFLGGSLPGAGSGSRCGGLTGLVGIYRAVITPVHGGSAN